MAHPLSAETCCPFAGYRQSRRYQAPQADVTDDTGPARPRNLLHAHYCVVAWFATVMAVLLLESLTALALPQWVHAALSLSFLLGSLIILVTLGMLAHRNRRSVILWVGVSLFLAPVSYFFLPFLVASWGWEKA